MQKTLGISPKVWMPAVGQVVVGVALLAFGLDVEGRTAIVTGLGTLAVGFQASPGVIVSEKPVDPEGIVR